MNSVMQKNLEKYDKWSDLKYCLQAVKKNGFNLKYVKIQTFEICLAAIREDGRALKYSKIQTPEICFEALNQNPEAYMYIKIILEAENEKDKFLKELGRIAIANYVKNPIKYP